MNGLFSENCLNEVTYHIFEYLEPNDLESVGLTCKNSAKEAADDKLWHEIAKRIHLPIQQITQKEVCAKE